MTKQEISFYDKPQVDTLLSAKANTADLATVATTGSYDDLTDKPTIPAAPEWGNISGTLANQTDLQTSLNDCVTSGGYDPNFSVFFITSRTGHKVGPWITIKTINNELLTSEQLLSGSALNINLAKPDMSNVAVNTSEAGKFLKVANDGSIAYDTPSGTVSVTDHTSYITLNY